MKEKIENLGKVAVTIEEGYWDIKKPYDKLTVVEREGTGTTFISRKPVPPGTSILNRKYWIKFSKWSDIPYEITQKFGDSEELAISQKTLTNKFDDVETEIREGDDVLDRRLRVIEAHERIMVDGGELEVATGYDLEHPESPRQEAAVPTVRAILDASDDEPYLNSTKRFVNSDNLAKMYGYYLDNPEFIEITLDVEGKIIEAIKVDGTKLLPAGVEINEKINFEGNETTIIENPEFVDIIFDSAGHILWGIQKDGNVYFGAGVPQQVVDYINKRIAELSLDEYEDIVAFLNGLEEGDKTLQTLLNEKVDKEEGKSLIDSEYASTKSTINNPEFLDVTLDIEDKILEGLQTDGTKVIGGDLNVDGSASVSGDFKVLSNMEVSGVSYKVIENPKYIEAKTDSEGKVLAGRTPDGAAFENVGFSTPKVFIDGHTIENIEDIEGRSEVITDGDGKVISYRDSAGVKHENVGLKPKRFYLEEEATQDIIDAITSAGFRAKNPMDFSEREFIEIPLPETCTIVNIERDEQAEAKNMNIHTYMEFWDMNGNYFRKPIILNAQGDSSLGMWKKNQAIDLDDGSKIKFGNWVPQDSFHLKKYYQDAFRGQCVVGYWLIEQMYQTRPYGERRPWDYLNLGGDYRGAIGSFKKDFPTGALAHPDGFPVHVYFNGNDAGVYSFNLKKHRDNYYADKKSVKNIILDGKLGMTEIFGGTIDWTTFEIRNPKSLKLVDGSDYDGDYPQEITGDENVDINTAKVKGYIQRLSDALTDINANKTKQKFEEYFNVPFFIDYFILANVVYHFDGFWKNWIWCTWDGNIWSPTCYDMDSIFGADTDGGKVIPAGEYIPLGDRVDERTNTNQVIGLSNPLVSILWELYEEEIKQRYAYLRDKDILSTNNIVRQLEKWVNKIGYDNLKDDITEVCVVDGHTHTPGYRDGSLIYPVKPVSGGFYNSILRVKRWLEIHFEYLDSNGIFNYTNNL